jgi:hypothetical protein
MKATNMWMACLTLLLMSGIGTSRASAQKSIESIVKELESKNVDENLVVKRNTKNKKVYLIVKNITFYSAGGTYARRLKAAFQNDSEKATNSSMINHGDNAYNYLYTLTFDEGKKKSVYSIRVSPGNPNPLVKMSVIIRDTRYGGSYNDDSDDDESMNLINLGDSKFDMGNLNNLGDLGKTGTRIIVNGQLMNDDQWQKYREQIQKFNDENRQQNEGLYKQREKMEQQREKMEQQRQEVQKQRQQVEKQRQQIDEQKEATSKQIEEARQLVEKQRAETSKQIEEARQQVDKQMKEARRIVEELNGN